MARVLSVSCLPVIMPPASNKKRSTHSGFTLIELLIVLVLMGMLGSLALPALGRLIDSLRYRSERADVLAQISSLSYRHYLLAQSGTLDTPHLSQPLQDGEPALKLPEGWSVRIPAPILFQFNGYCSGGVMILNAPEHAPETISLTAPNCGVSDAG